MALLYINGPRLKKLIFAGAKWLIFNEQELNDINVFPVPDGDTGSNMGATLRSVVHYIENSVNENDLADVANGMANAALMGARGNSGVILSQVFKGIANGVGDKPKLNAKALIEVMQKGCDQAYSAIAEPVEGTILTVIKDCVAEAAAIVDSGEDIETLMDKLLYGAKESLQRTPDLLPALKEAGVVDSGGQGFVFILEGIYKFINGEQLPELYEHVLGEKKDTKAIVDVSTTYGYCSELLIHTQYDVDMIKLKQDLLGFGDSLVLADNSSIIKVHLHTQNPGTLLEHCLQLGVISDVKIENMDAMHHSMEVHSKETLIIAVALGEGVKEIFKSLGCGYVLVGGQTMNPSVEDIDEVVHKSKAKNIIILPNNSNVFLAADQVKKLNQGKNKNIYVVPTKSVPEGFAAMLAYSAEKEIDDVMCDMMLAVNGVKTGEITEAAKSSVVDGVEIVAGDIINIFDKKIKPEKNIHDSLFSLLEDMVDEDEDTIITIYYGNSIELDAVDKLVNEIEKKYDDMDIEVHFGGQPHYFFIVSVE